MKYNHKNTPASVSGTLMKLVKNARTPIMLRIRFIEQKRLKAGDLLQ